MKKILFASAECAPFIKTGGLGAVVGSLPKQINQKKFEVRVVLPCYECIDKKWRERMTTEVTFPVHLGWRTQPAIVKKLSYEGIIYYFIENNFYYCGDSPYFDMWVDIEKFSFFSKAVLEMLSYLKYEPDIIHCHDWHSSLIPVFLNAFYKRNPFYKKIKTIITIHNLKYQGTTDINRLKDITGLPDSFFTSEGLEFYHSANLLKGGLMCADQITTVSRTYAAEIMQPEYGEGLDGVLRYRAKDVSGIVNGIDYDLYDPSKDPYLSQTYDATSFQKGKQKNRGALQEKTGLAKKKVFTMGIVSRLTDQKGFALFTDIMDRLLKMPLQLYVLGDGEETYRNMFLSAKAKYPKKVFVQFDYNDEMAKAIYAGCDAILMPSLFEPCGLCQLMALRYGAVPVVRKTGGLNDTVSAYNQKRHTGTGFVFQKYDSEAFFNEIKKARDVYKDSPLEWNGIIERGMKKNFSWKTSSKKYEKLYERMLSE